ncbi:hypothetical protein P7K49_029149 [Saguinus oedipus]|uniref:Uncharacterized protein n=1 Tax=Saguinus oedipus TaxID=9490 RepID=A0ABQ9U6D9_SAGOE|nr:hypothetical protein P7K49_029149 [Saguinus oedipus]
MLLYGVIVTSTPRGRQVTQTDRAALVTAERRPHDSLVVTGSGHTGAAPPQPELAQTRRNPRELGGSAALCPSLHFSPSGARHACKHRASVALGGWRAGSVPGRLLEGRDSGVAAAPPTSPPPPPVLGVSDPPAEPGAEETAGAGARPSEARCRPHPRVWCGAGMIPGGRLETQKGQCSRDRPSGASFGTAPPSSLCSGVHASILSGGPPCLPDVAVSPGFLREEERLGSGFLAAGPPPQVGLLSPQGLS